MFVFHYWPLACGEMWGVFPWLFGGHVLCPEVKFTASPGSLSPSWCFALWPFLGRGERSSPELSGSCLCVLMVPHLTGGSVLHEGAHSRHGIMSGCFKHPRCPFRLSERRFCTGILHWPFTALLSHCASAETVRPFGIRRHLFWMHFLDTPGVWFYFVKPFENL